MLASLPPDADDLAIAEHLAREVGQALVAARARWIAERRSWWDIESGADQLGHDLLVDALTELRPADAVLSEEGDDHGDRHGAARCWIVDPLDGSADFPDPASGAFAIHVALVEDGAVPVAAVSLPAIDALHSTGEPHALDPDRSEPIVVGGRSVVGFTRRLAAELGGTPTAVGSSGVKAMAVVRGLRGTEWLIQAMQQAEGFAVDLALPITDLEPEAVEKYGLEKYATGIVDE